MRKIIFVFFILTCQLSVFSQSRSIEKLYKLYDKREFVKCVEKSDKIISKDEYALEAYYLKALSYFEMAQLPQRYTDFTKDPLMECLRTLNILRIKDTDEEIFEEHKDQLQLIYEYTEYYVNQIKETNQDKSILYLQRLSRAFGKNTGALDLAKIYAHVGNYEQCMRQISRLYEKSPEEISSSHENYTALTKGALLLAENWMFRDLFWLVHNYKPKYGNVYAINNGFKDAILLSIDTAKGDKNKDYFFNFSKEGLELYGDDREFTSQVEKIWLSLINNSIQEFRKSSDTVRTWRDSIHLRNTFQYTSMAREIMPTSQKLNEKEKQLRNEFNIYPSSYEQSLIRKYALEAVNKWRDEGCECDTGRVVYMKPVFTVEWDTILHRLAQEHAVSMFEYNYTKHINPKTNENPWDRVNSTFLKGETFETDEGTYFLKASKIGEVLGHGYALGSLSAPSELDSLVYDVVETWIKTRFSQNCAKIMTPKFTHMGMGVCGDKWVLFFAEINSILINKK